MTLLGGSYNPNRVPCAHDDGVTRYEATTKVLCDCVRAALA